jgi:CheY-like chemotaxis protein
LLEVSLPKIVEGAIESVRPTLEAKGIALVTHVELDAPLVLGDPNRLQQVAWNLLSNAIKFTPKGGRVELTVACVGSQIELVVSDNGQGIEASFLPFLFQRFHQAEGGATRRQGGLGLGLAICRHLVELHGGTIEASSDGVGRGATIRVKLPLLPIASRSPERRKVQTARNPNLPLVAPPELKDLKVLVVDDQLDAREIIASVITNCGGIALEAGSADEAFSMVVSRRPDVILSDIGMPGEDGYSLIRRVRELPPEDGGRTPAAALTAYARAEDRRQALVAGFEMHVPKPVEPVELLTVVATLARIGNAIR